MDTLLFPVVEGGVRRGFRDFRECRAWHKEQWVIFGGTKLFSFWLDFFMLLKLGVAKVCYFRVLLTIYDGKHVLFAKYSNIYKEDITNKIEI